MENTFIFLLFNTIVFYRTNTVLKSFKALNRKGRTVKNNPESCQRLRLAPKVMI